MEKETPLTALHTAEYEIGGITFIVNSSYNSSSKEGLVDKVVRLIENDNRCADTQAHL